MPSASSSSTDKTQKESSTVCHPLTGATYVTSPMNSSPRVTSGKLLERFRSHSGQTQDACAVPAIILQRKIQTNVASFTSKRNAVSENVSFLR